MVVFWLLGINILLEARYLAFRFLWLASSEWVQGLYIRPCFLLATEANYGEFFMAEAATAAKVTLQGDGSILVVNAVLASGAVQTVAFSIQWWQ